jgi:hypothetical protein
MPLNSARPSGDSERAREHVLPVRRCPGRHRPGQQPTIKRAGEARFVSRAIAARKKRSAARSPGPSRGSVVGLLDSRH